MMRRAARMCQNCIQNFSQKICRKGPIGKIRRRRQEDNKMDPTEEVGVTDSFCTGTREMRPRIVQNAGNYVF